MTPPKSPVDRRSTPRHTVAYRLDVAAPDGTSGCLLDISGTGMRLRFRGGLDVAGTERMRVDFPRWLELGSGLDVRGRFVWVRADPRGVTEAGFAFDGLGKKELSVVTVLIQRLAEAAAEDQAVATAG